MVYALSQARCIHFPFSFITLKDTVERIDSKLKI